MFNRLPKCICMLSSCSVNRFKSEQHDSYLRNIVDLPCQPRFNNSLDGGDCLHGGHNADNLRSEYVHVIGEEGLEPNFTIIFLDICLTSSEYNRDSVAPIAMNLQRHYKQHSLVQYTATWTCHLHREFRLTTDITPPTHSPTTLPTPLQPKLSHMSHSPRVPPELVTTTTTLTT